MTATDPLPEHEPPHHADTVPLHRIAVARSGDKGDSADVAVVDQAEAEAECVGFPVLLKASAGGGGKGMRILATPSVRQGFAALTYFYGTEEFHEGTSAFRERRAPNFRPHLD